PEVRGLLRSARCLEVALSPDGGGRGHTHCHFQCCTFGRSVTSPKRSNFLQIRSLRHHLSAAILSKAHLSKLLSNSGPLNVRHTVKAGAFRVADGRAEHAARC